MTTVLLIRHALTAHVGSTISGRLPHVGLSGEGRRQAEALADRLASRPIRAIYSSSLERAMATAEPLARRLGLSAQVRSRLDELHFGEWTGKSFAALGCDPLWGRFNTFRSLTRIPGGELMLEVQARAVAELVDLRARHPEEAVAVVSHGDVIRAALAHYLGIHLDLIQRLEISPASVSVVTLEGGGVRVLSVNETLSTPSDLTAG
jgi:probable phosphoglycerate mutase